MNRFPVLSFIFFLLFFLPQTSHAALTMLDQGTGAVSLNGHLEVLSDPSGTLTIDDVTRPGVAGRFKTTPGRFSGGYTKDVVWLRFTLQKTDAKADNEWWLEIYPPFLDYVTFYEPVNPDTTVGFGEKRSFIDKHAGRLLPLSAREIAERNFVFVVELTDTKPRTYFMRVQTTGAMFVDAKIWDIHSFAKSSGMASMLLGGFYGVLGLLVALNLIFWFVLRDRLFIIYALFLVSLALALLSANGYASLYLFPDAPYLVYLMNGISIPLILITGTLLIEELIPLDKQGFWRRSFVAVRAAAVLGILLVLAGRFRIVAGPLMFVGLYTSLACVAVSALGIYRRTPSAKLYGITFMVYYIGGIMITIRNTNLFGLSCPIMDNASQIGSAIHMVLIQIAIALRFYHMEQERKETREKMENEMIRSQKLESIAILGGGIAHDFNNMLTVIMSTVTLAKMYSGNNTNAVGKLDEAECEIMHARELTNQLLTFAKGSAPVRRLSSLSGLLRDTVEFSIKGSAVKCEFSIAGDLWPAEIDRTQISQVISNLVINAIQAMPQGGTLTVRAGNAVLDGQSGVPMAGHFVVIIIEDSGPGISPEHREKVFDPFFTTKPRGSGLGLAICYSIVSKHNGHIGMQSQAGIGSVFRVYLPASPNARVEEEPLREGRELKGSGRVLLMDDDEKLLENVGEMLEALGYEVETARNGEEALILYKRSLAFLRLFDAVVMDMTVIGGMGGRQCLQELMKLAPRVKAIVMSGYVEDNTLAEYGKYGFREALSKPFSIEELHGALQRVITDAERNNA
ncbi:MAG: response regulator [Nitrospirae bacterium]|nr:response regulator [Nitrospirota bacterium]